MRSPTVYATTVKEEMEGNKKEKYLFYGSAMITFWAIWVLADFLGALVGASFPLRNTVSRFRHGRHPLSPSLVPQIKSRACTVAAVVAAVSGDAVVVLPIRWVSTSSPRCLASSPACASTWRKSASRWQKPGSDMPLVEAMENE